MIMNNFNYLGEMSKMNPLHNNEQPIAIESFTPNLNELFKQRFSNLLVKLDHTLYYKRAAIIQEELSYIYDIFAVCEHFGSRYGGHYTAICRNYDGKWYSYDDSNCSEAEEKEVCSKNAYVLFYRRRDW